MALFVSCTTVTEAGNIRRDCERNNGLIETEQLTRQIRRILRRVEKEEDM